MSEARRYTPERGPESVRTLPPDTTVPPHVVAGGGGDAPPTEVGNGGAEQPRLWGAHTFVSLGITVALLIALSLTVDFHEVLTELQNANLWLALLGLCCHYATYPVRGMRWRRCVRQLDVRASNHNFGLIVFFYNFVDNVVPAKLGDLYGAHLAKINLGIKRSAALGSIVFLRMIDAWILLVLAGVSSWFVFARHMPETVVWALVFGGIVAVAATLIIVTFFLVGHRLPDRLSESFKHRVESFRIGMWPKKSQYAGVLALTALVWGLEAAWTLSLAAAFGIELNAMELIFLTTIPLLASATPVTPAGAGVVEVAMFGCLRAIGVASPIAVSLTVLNRFIDYWLHIGLGLGAWALRDRIGLRTWREVPIPDDTEAEDAS